MNTALLQAMPREFVTVAEAAVALVLAMLAVGLRRRRREFSTCCFLVALSLLADLLSHVTASPVALYLWALAQLLFLFGLIRLLLELLVLAARRGRAHFSSISKDLLLLLLYAVVALGVLRWTLGVDITPLLATSAVATVVIGLGFQETLGNIFSGLTLQLQKPFLPGDWVRFGNYLGRIHGIGWRSTQLVTRAHEKIEIPNSLLAKDVLTNYASAAIGDEISVQLSYDDAPGHAKAAITKVLQNIPEVLSQPPPEVHVSSFEDSGIRYRIRYWLSDYGPAENVRDRVISSLWYALRRHSIDIPFPTRAVYMHQVAGSEQVAAAREQQTIEQLRQVDFLSALGDDELQMLLPTVRIHQFGHGETLMREGEAGDSFYIMRSGTVEVLVKTPNDGGTIHIRDLEPPAFFGEISLMTGEPRSATIRARSHVEVLEINRDGFMLLFKKHPEVAEQVGEIIAARTSETRDRVAAAQTTTSDGANRHRLLAKMRAIFDF
ncbi:MAG: mechanosensitive ion channel family protein [Candidatus Binataceae bacterium]|jgi:small-conductance mechanosensitive channel/CRP-like cAMP-binding protein